MVQKSFFVLLAGIGLAGTFLSIILYPLFLPRTIITEHVPFIESLGIAFYGIFFGSIMLVFLGVTKFLSLQERESTAMRVLAEALNRRNGRNILVTSGFLYGLLSAIVSGMLIFSQHNFHHTEGIVLISYGPSGYAPTVAITLTENIGFLLIPINALIIAVLSYLVGINAVVFFTMINAKRSGKSLNMVGIMTGLFASCPTCASFYILSGMAASGSIMSIISQNQIVIIAISMITLLVAPYVTIKLDSKSRCRLQ